MVSRRDIRCGGQVCPCSSARWHAKQNFRREGQGLSERRPAAGAPFVLWGNRDKVNPGRLPLDACTVGAILILVFNDREEIATNAETVGLPNWPARRGWLLEQDSR